MKKITKKQKQQFTSDIKVFINTLAFEDAGTVIQKTYKWLKKREDIVGFGVDVNIETNIVNAFARFMNGEVIAFTMFDGN